ncbi:MAG TPA: PQQ-binding-like beta-propeller repeat protein, partial [Acidimicrobiales bacterium]
MASDGEWYPPELHPDARSDPVTSSATVSAADGLGRIDTFGGATMTVPTATAHHTTADGSSRPAPRRRWPRRLLPVGALAVVVALVFGGIDIAPGGATGWTDPSLDVVGSPVVSGRNVLVVDVTSRHQLELSAVDASDGSIAWRRPFSASAITPGVSFEPVVLGATALVLSPTGRATDMSVVVKGVDVSTGRLLWSLPESLVVSDAPTVCSGGKDFCVATFISNTTTALVIVAPATGHVVSVLQGPNRAMATSPTSDRRHGDLWQTNDVTPTLMEVSSTGSALWTKTVSALFGGSQFNPDNGWDFLERGSLIVGSVGIAPTGHSLPLSGFRTVGIGAVDGTVKWNVAGFYLCGGGLGFLTADVLCKYSGMARVSSSSVSMSGVGLTLEGLNPDTGTTTWSTPVLDAQALSLGTNVAFADGTHLVVRLTSNRQVVLDVTHGSSRPVGAGDVFWCEEEPTYSVVSPPGTLAGGRRVSAPVFRTCSAAGTSVTALPITRPA